MSILIQRSIDYVPTIPDAGDIVLYISEAGALCALNSQGIITNLSETNNKYYKRPIDTATNNIDSVLRDSSIRIGYRAIDLRTGIIYELTKNKVGEKTWIKDNQSLPGAIAFSRNIESLNRYYYSYDGKTWVKNTFSDNNNHVNDKNNPHHVTKDQVGLDQVKNEKLIAILEFEQHLSAANPHLVTKDQIGLGKLNNVPTVPQTVLIDHTNVVNPHAVTKDQIGLENVQNEPQVNVRKYKEHITDYNNPHHVTKEDLGLGDIKNIQSYPKDRFQQHLTATNPHAVTKEQLGLGNVDNVQQTTLEDYQAHTETIRNPHLVTKEQLGLSGIENVEQISAAEYNEHVTTPNPHHITKADVGLDKISNDELATKVEYNNHVSNTENPHHVTKADVGLGNVENVEQVSAEEFNEHVMDTNPHRTSLADIGLDAIINEPSISTETWNGGRHAHVKLTAADVGLDKVGVSVIVSESVLTDHVNSKNPHHVTKGQLGLSAVDNTADIDKPISNAQFDYLSQFVPIKDLAYAADGSSLVVPLCNSDGQYDPNLIIAKSSDTIVPIGWFEKDGGTDYPTFHLFSPLDGYYANQFANFHTIDDLMTAISYGSIKIRGLQTLIIHIKGNELSDKRLSDGDRIVLYVSDTNSRTVDYGVLHNTIIDPATITDNIKKFNPNHTVERSVTDVKDYLFDVTPLATNRVTLSKEQYKGVILGIPFMDQIEIQYKNNIRTILGFPLMLDQIQPSLIPGVDVLQLGDGAEISADTHAYNSNRSMTVQVADTDYWYYYCRNNSYLQVMNKYADCTTDNYAVIIFNDATKGYRSSWNQRVPDTRPDTTRDQKFKAIDVLLPKNEAGIPHIKLIEIISTSLVDYSVEKNCAVKTSENGVMFLYVRSTVAGKVLKLYNGSNDTIGMVYVIEDAPTGITYNTSIGDALHSMSPSKEFIFIENKTDEELMTIATNPYNEVYSTISELKAVKEIYCCTQSSVIQYSRLCHQLIKTEITTPASTTMLFVFSGLTFVVGSNAQAGWIFVSYEYGYCIPTQYKFNDYISYTSAIGLYSNNGEAGTTYLSMTDWDGVILTDVAPKIGIIPSPVNPTSGHFLTFNPGHCWYPYLFYSTYDGGWTGKNGNDLTLANGVDGINGRLHPFPADAKIIGYVMISAGEVILLKNGEVWRLDVNYKLDEGQSQVNPLRFTRLIEPSQCVSIQSMYTHNVLLVSSTGSLTVLNPYTGQSHSLNRSAIPYSQSIIAINSFTHYSIIVTSDLSDESRLVYVYYLDHLTEQIVATGITDWMTDDLSTIRIRMTNGIKEDKTFSQTAGNYIDIHGSDCGIMIPWNPYNTVNEDMTMRTVTADSYGRPMYNTRSAYCNLFTDLNINRLNIENDNLYHVYKS